MFSWNFREMWGHLGWLRDDLEQAEASAQARWGRQHNGNGTHGAVTATSLSATLVQAGRFGLSVSRNQTPTTSSGGFQVITSVAPATPAAIVEIVPDTTDDTYLLAMSTAGRELGEIVILRAAYDHGLTHFGFVIRSNASTTPPADAARFLTLGDGTGTNYDVPTCDVGGSIVVRLETAQPTSTSSFATYWRVLGVMSSV